ncbi:hypothetical protein FKM82_025515 [Ascaphus truei]
MPEVRDLSDAQPDASMDPITGVGVVASRNRAPAAYDVVSGYDGVREGETIIITTGGNKRNNRIPGKTRGQVGLEL